MHVWAEQTASRWVLFARHLTPFSFTLLSVFALRRQLRRQFDIACAAQTVPSVKDEFFAVAAGMVGQSVLEAFCCNIWVNGRFDASNFGVIAELD